MNDRLEEGPRAGVLVRDHISAILDYLENVDQDEFGRLLTKDYSSERFRLSFPFFKEVESIDADGDGARFWTTVYEVRGQRVRICNHWTDSHRPFFLTYLVTLGIPVVGVSPGLQEEWLAEAQQVGSVARRSGARGGARYRSYAIGISQNAFVRHILSNLGKERFTELDWNTVKSSFGDSCAYCGETGMRLEMDHAIPLNMLQLGEHRLGNVVPACAKCNGEKSQTRFRPYLLEKYKGDPGRAAMRVKRIESHMMEHGYRPLGDREDVRELIRTGREEVASLAKNYIDLINGALSEDGARLSPNQTFGS